MPRPSEPLIQRDAAIATALQIIDESGVEALSLRKLGAALGVHGMSLYHHFADKQEILDGVASLILSDLHVSLPEGDFISWSLGNARRYRRALLAHPNAIPLFVAGHPVRARERMYEAEYAALAAQRVPRKHWRIFLETIEAFIVGSAMYLRPSGSAQQPGAGAHRYESAFDTAYRALVAGLLDAYST